MGNELLHDLMERSAELTPEEKQSFARFLAEQEHRGNGEGLTINANDNNPGDNGMTPNAVELHSQRREQHLAWLKAHRHEYSGRYVALDGDQLMATGRNIKEAAERAKDNGCDTPFLVYVLSNDVLADGGL